MIDSKTIVTQVQELQLIFHDLIFEGMVVNEAVQVATMIKKLPPSWRDFKNCLKHKRKKMKLEDLIIRLKIEEDNKTAEKKSLGNSTVMGANIIKDTTPKSKKRKRSSRQTKEQNKKIFKGYCYNCRKAECNLVGNSKEWRIDSGATRHVCAVKEAFATYSTAGPEEEFFMGNTAITKIKGYEKIFLKMTSGKVLTLNNVLFMFLLLEKN
ncbi:uncharacterized protein [Nicotiana tomentosiformis]|uniref:uncharacterized protein n=1 Tax=Nicotiana tomentosiformis TaxID=4098 RepID=UPI00388C39AE